MSDVTPSKFNNVKVNELRLNSEYNDWDEFFRAVKIYCDTTYQPFVKHSSKTVAAHNKNLKNPYPEELQWFYRTLMCTHRGAFIPRGTGLRDTKSNKEGCKAKIHACLDKDSKTKVVVKILKDDHNHEIGPHLYTRYAHNRCLDKEERNYARKLCKLNFPAKNLRQELEHHTGKKVTLQDVHNIKKFKGQQDQWNEIGSEDNENANETEDLTTWEDEKSKLQQMLAYEKGEHVKTREELTLEVNRHEEVMKELALEIRKHEETKRRLTLVRENHIEMTKKLALEIKKHAETTKELALETEKLTTTMEQLGLENKKHANTTNQLALEKEKCTNTTKRKMGDLRGEFEVKRRKVEKKNEEQSLQCKELVLANVQLVQATRSEQATNHSVNASTSPLNASTSSVNTSTSSLKACKSLLPRETVKFKAKMKVPEKLTPKTRFNKTLEVLDGTWIWNEPTGYLVIQEEGRYKMIVESKQEGNGKVEMVVQIQVKYSWEDMIKIGVTSAKSPFLSCGGIRTCKKGDKVRLLARRLGSKDTPSLAFCTFTCSRME